MCLATQSDMTIKVILTTNYFLKTLQFHANEFISRNSNTHNEYINLIEEDGGHRSRHSTTYGINSRSPLIRLTGFDITKCLPYDIMHTIFEGVAMLHLQHLLHYLIDVKNFLSLEQLNVFIRSHKYGYSEVSTKPSMISKDSTSNYVIKQSGTCIKFSKLY